MEINSCTCHILYEETENSPFNYAEQNQILIDQEVHASIALSLILSENGHNALYFRTDRVDDSDGYKFRFPPPSDLGDSDRYIIRLKEGLTFWYFSFAMCLKHMSIIQQMKTVVRPQSCGQPAKAQIQKYNKHFQSNLCIQISKIQQAVPTK